MGMVGHKGEELCDAQTGERADEVSANHRTGLRERTVNNAINQDCRSSLVS